MAETRIIKAIVDAEGNEYLPDAGGVTPEELAAGLAKKLDKADYSGFPSDTYVTLSLLGNGTRVGPFAVDGWVTLLGESTTETAHIAVTVEQNAMRIAVPAPRKLYPLAGFVPISAGQTVGVNHSGLGNVTFRFIPARRAPGV